MRSRHPINGHERQLKLNSRENLRQRRVHSVSVPPPKLKHKIQASSSSSDKNSNNNKGNDSSSSNEQELKLRQLSNPGRSNPSRNSNNDSETSSHSHVQERRLSNQLRAMVSSRSNDTPKPHSSSRHGVLSHNSNSNSNVHKPSNQGLNKLALQVSLGNDSASNRVRRGAPLSHSRVVARASEVDSAVQLLPLKDGRDHKLVGLFALFSFEL